MDKLARLEAEADRRSRALAQTASRFARRFGPLKLADEALGRLGPASEMAERAAYVARRYPMATIALTLSVAFLTWQYLRRTDHLTSSNPKRALTGRRKTGSRRKPPRSQLISHDQGAPS
jgi:hypothetical protein